MPRILTKIMSSCVRRKPHNQTGGLLNLANRLGFESLQDPDSESVLMIIAIVKVLQKWLEGDWWLCSHSIASPDSFFLGPQGL